MSQEQAEYLTGLQAKYPTMAATWPQQENKLNVYAKLNAARKAFHAIKMEKTGLNKFSGYSYFTLADFLLPAIKCFDDVGLCAIVGFTADVASMVIVDVDGGQTITITSPMGSAMLKGCHEVQNIGAVESYQRRYLWMAALEIVEHDALDATTGKMAKGQVVADSFRSSGTMGVLESLTLDQQTYIRDLADELKAMPDVSEVVSRIDFEELEADQKVALWSLLPSALRTAIKAEQAARKVTK